jgi:signal peptidase II
LYWLSPVVESKTEEHSARLKPSRVFLKRRRFAIPDLRAQLVFWTLAVGGLALDLWTKKSVFGWLQHKPGNSVSIVDGFLQLVTAMNEGAAFGIAAGRHHLLLAISIIAMIVIFGIFLCSGGQRTLIHVSLALFAAGVCGNLWDRIFNDGQVRDFIDVVYWPGRHWPAFNVADAMLCIGIGLLVLSTFFTERSCRKRAQQQK